MSSSYATGTTVCLRESPILPARVGVVGNTRIGPRDGNDNDQWYVPAEQPATLNGSGSSEKPLVPAGGFLVLRSQLPEERMIGILHETVAKIDPLLAIDQVEPMSYVISKTEAQRFFMTELVGAFSMAALVLCITGIYAVMSFAVSLRAQEIAIRMALGAERDRIVALVLRSGTELALFGCGIGVVSSLTLSRFLRSFLFGVTATDPWIYTASVGLMIIVAILASLIPAVRAARAEPVEVLRSAQ